MTRTLVWFRDDLRTHDHPGLVAACERAETDGDVVGVYILDDSTPGIRPLGGAARWWAHYALESLREDLSALGIPLLIRHGRPERMLPELVADCAAERVHWSRRYGGGERRADSEIKAALHDDGVDAESFPASLLREPWQIQTSTGGPYKVFTPFWRALSAEDFRAPLPEPEPVGPIQPAAASLSGAGVALGELDQLELLPQRPDWATGLRRTWDPTLAGGHRQLQEFLDGPAEHYEPESQLPAAEATSRLSPYLRFGQLSPHQVWEASQSISDENSRVKFRSELVWREFCQHLLYHFPRLPDTNMRAAFDAYPWKAKSEDPETFNAWAAGKTGFPLVDAGMRELWETGHMHNRVRMAAASLLVKNLGIHWREGEAWFWDTLVDADPASNPVNWQWVAGSGVDAAPYFRIFNPERQQKRFDPDLSYVKHWVPELGTDEYPEPLVDLGASREEALAHYSSLTSG